MKNRRGSHIVFRNEVRKWTRVDATTSSPALASGPSPNRRRQPESSFFQRSNSDTSTGMIVHRTPYRLVPWAHAWAVEGRLGKNHVCKVGSEGGSEVDNISVN